MGKRTTSWVGTTFALLIGASLMVACTSTTGGVPPSATSVQTQNGESESGKIAGSPTLSPNANSVMSVIDPSGDGTPVPMYAVTPAPVSSVTPRTEETEIVADPPMATRMAQQDPRILTLEGAQEVVPFHIQKAEYIPEGYERDQWVMMLEGFAYGNEVKGVMTRYVPIGLKPFPFPHEMMVEQYLGEETTDHGGLTPSSPENVGSFEAQVYEIPEAGIIRLSWRDPEPGINFDVVSTFDKEETLRIVRSLK